MEIPEPIDEGLPAPRDDEPEALRDDIVAELNDHLQCAFLRERHRCSDAEGAWRAVVKRFGRPRDVARRLWWDNMKEQIMRGRIAIGLMTLAVVACFSAVGVSWMAFSQLSKSNEQSQQTNLALLAKLDEMRTQRPAEPAAGASAKPVSQWTTLRVRMVKAKPSDVLKKDAAGKWVKQDSGSDDEEREPASGINVTLNGKAYNSTQDVRRTETSDQDGWVKFGPMLVGKYNLQVTMTWGYSLHYGIVLLPAEEHVKTIKCPVDEQEKVSVRFEVDWPEDLRDCPALLCCSLILAQLDLDRNSIWRCNVSQRFAIDPHNQMLFEPSFDSSLSTTGAEGERFVPNSFRGREGFGSGFASRFKLVKTGSSSRLEMTNPFFIEGENRLVDRMIEKSELWVGDYRLSQMAVAIPIGDGERYEWKRLTLPKNVQYTAKPGEETVWKFKLPESLVVLLRKRFAQVSRTEQTKLMEKRREEILEKLGESLSHISGVRIDVPIEEMRMEYSGDTSAEAPVMLLTQVRPTVVIPEASFLELAKLKLPDVEDPSKEQLAKEHQGVIEDVKRLVREAIPKSAEMVGRYFSVETEQTKQAKKDREELEKNVLEALKDIPGVRIEWQYLHKVSGRYWSPTIIVPESYVLDEWRKAQQEKDGKEPSPPTETRHSLILHSFLQKIVLRVSELLPVVGTFDDRKKKVQVTIVNEKGGWVGGHRFPSGGF